MEHWVLFSKEGCPHCVNAKDTLNKRLKNNKGTILNIIPKEKYEEYKSTFPCDMDTWPRIFLFRDCKGKCNSERRKCDKNCKTTIIGGFADLERYLNKS
jgi:glutaredoxin